MIKYLSLFSGIGGFERGIEQTTKKKDFKCIGYSEVDKYAQNIYKRHYPNHIGYGDVTKIKTEEIPEFDFLVGGFPCQSFSIAGKQGGFNDTRGTLFFEIARVLKDKRPRYFLLENVKNLLSHDKGKTFKTILEVFAGLGYNVQWQVYNSKNYGVPQNRERIYIKGHLATAGGSRQKILLDPETVGTGTPNNKKVNMKRDTTRTNTIVDVKNISPTLTASGQQRGGRIIIVGNTSKTNHGTHNIINSEGICPTIIACNYKQPRLIKVNEKPKNIRKLTPVECERLQGFPDNWTQYGADGALISDTQRYKCCGNAVTTNVIQHIIENWGMY